MKTAILNPTGLATLFVLASVFHSQLASAGGCPAPSFAAPVVYNAVYNSYSLVVGDFNGDGKLDLAVANSCSSDVSVLLGNGDGSFQAAINLSSGSAPVSLAVADFNGDGKPDLAVVNHYSTNVSVFLGNGDGTFQTAASHGTGIYPVFVAVGDFNGDAKLDLAVAGADGRRRGPRVARHLRRPGSRPDRLRPHPPALRSPPARPDRGQLGQRWPAIRRRLATVVPTRD